MDQTEIERIRAELPEGYRLCAPRRPRAGRRKVKAVYCFKVKAQDQFTFAHGVYTNKCFECHREQQKAYYRRAPVHHRKVGQQWREANREKIRESHRTEEFKQRRREYERRTWVENPELRERRLARYKRWYEANREDVLAKRREEAKYKKALLYAAIPTVVAHPYVLDALEAARREQIAELEFKLIHPPEEVLRGSQRQQSSYKGRIASSIDSVTGVRKLSEWAGLSSRVMSNHVAGRTMAIGQTTLDNILLHTGHSISEVVETTLKWAKENNDPWPMGYSSKGWNYFHGSKEDYPMDSSSS